MTDINAKIDATLRASSDLFLDILRGELAGTDKVFESPIERLFHAAMWSKYVRAQMRGLFIPPSAIAQTAWYDLSDLRPLGDKVWLEFNYSTQVKIDTHRVDFLFATIPNPVAGPTCQIVPVAKFLAVECDGHEFHDRTREQASRDRARDRTLAAKEVHVVRFTGSDIWADPIGCADEVYKILVTKSESAISAAWDSAEGGDA